METPAAIETKNGPMTGAEIGDIAIDTSALRTAFGIKASLRIIVSYGNGNDVAFYFAPLPD